jgi:pyrroline-5-carboxylate reductase
MCEAIVKGLLRDDPSVSLSVCEAYETRRKYLQSTYPRMTVSESAETVIRASDVVIIAVKPQQLASAFSSLTCALEPLYVSICAGVTLNRLEEVISSDARITRVMPNLPAMVGEGASGFCSNSKCRPTDSDLVKKIFSAVGAVAEQVSESLMDVVTAVSGSGPAYILLLIDAMADAAVKEGMPRDIALRLAAQTCVGAGKMVLAGGDANHPGVLKDKICSPGGTTIAAVTALEEHGFRAAAIAAVSAAAEKSRSLGKL